MGRTESTNLKSSVLAAGQWDGCGSGRVEADMSNAVLPTVSFLFGMIIN